MSSHPMWSVSRKYCYGGLCTRYPVDCFHSHYCAYGQSRSCGRFWWFSSDLIVDLPHFSASPSRLPRIFSCILFRMFFGVPRSVIWYLPVSLIVGATLGAVTCGLLCEKNSFMVFGVCYGLVSGLSAWYFRPERS